MNGDFDLFKFIKSFIQGFKVLFKKVSWSPRFLKLGTRFTYLKDDIFNWTSMVWVMHRCWKGLQGNAHIAVVWKMLPLCIMEMLPLCIMVEMLSLCIMENVNCYLCSHVINKRRRIGT